MADPKKSDKVTYLRKGSQIGGGDYADRHGRAATLAFFLGMTPFVTEVKKDGSETPISGVKLVDGVFTLPKNALPDDEVVGVRAYNPMSVDLNSGKAPPNTPAIDLSAYAQDGDVLASSYPLAPTNVERSTADPKQTFTWRVDSDYEPPPLRVVTGKNYAKKAGGNSGNVGHKAIQRQRAPR